MKHVVWLVLAGLCVAGCATNTIEKRREQKASVYAALDAELKAAVDQGQIKVGMTPDAVYIAWGKPSQVLTSESSDGSYITWLYQNHRLKSYHYWTTHTFLYEDYHWRHPYLATSYYPVEYVSAEVVFQDGKVKEWRTLPAPVF